jgi:mRNA guanylyltransferase
MNGPKFSIETPGVKAEGALLQEFRREVAQLLDRHSLGFPGAQPVSFARRHLDELKKQE